MRLGFHQFNAHKAFVAEGRMSVRSKGALAWRLFPAITTLGTQLEFSPWPPAPTPISPRRHRRGFTRLASLVRRRLRRLRPIAVSQPREEPGGASARRREAPASPPAARQLPGYCRARPGKGGNPRPEFRRLQSFRPWGWPPRSSTRAQAPRNRTGSPPRLAHGSTAARKFPRKAMKTFEIRARKREAPEASAPSDAY